MHLCQNTSQLHGDSNYSHCFHPHKKFFSSQLVDIIDGSCILKLVCYYFTMLWEFDSKDIADGFFSATVDTATGTLQ